MLAADVVTLIWPWYSSTSRSPGSAAIVYVCAASPASSSSVQVATLAATVQPCAAPGRSRSKASETADASIVTVTSTAAVGTLLMTSTLMGLGVVASIAMLTTYSIFGWAQPNSTGSAARAGAAAASAATLAAA